jgi:uncharacterized protein YndB with AHSA1/START domain
MMKQSLILISLLASVPASAVNAQDTATIPIDHDAPVVQTEEITINAKPEVVWDVLTDIEKWSKWNEKIKHSTINEEADIGVSFTWKTNGSKIRSQIHTFERNKTLGWTGKAFGAKAIHNWYLEPTKNGTRVLVNESMGGWLVRLFKRKVTNTVEEDMAYWLEQLKIESEN